MLASGCSFGDQRCAQLDVVVALLAAGADVNAANRQGWTALFAAATVGAADVVEALLQAGAAVDAAAQDGNTPLMNAILSIPEPTSLMHPDYDAVVAALLDGGAQPSLSCAGGFTPLHVAARVGNISNIKKLLAAGALLEARTDEHGECEPFE
jgi:ankyrin repeat protein